jgi:hypothetical protein
MADVTLDIATKLVPPDQHIWAMFPGLGRRFFGRFRDEGLIFLEMPGINLTRRALEDDNVLRQHVAMSLIRKPPDARATGQKTRPGRLDIGGKGRDRSHACNDNPSHLFSGLGTRPALLSPWPNPM